MRVYCEESVGAGVANALHAVRLDAFSSVNVGLRTNADTAWLPIAGRLGWLVLTHDLSMLKHHDELQAIIDNRVGVVFLTDGQMAQWRVLRLLLNAWEELERLDAETPRPFARFLLPSGQWSSSFNELSLPPP